MKINEDQTIATEDTESGAAEVRDDDLGVTDEIGNSEDATVGAKAEEGGAGQGFTMGVNWSVGSGRRSSETAVLAIRKIADVVLLLLISIALAIAITVTLIVGASWGWGFVWNAIRG